MANDKANGRSRSIGPLDFSKVDYNPPIDSIENLLRDDTREPEPLLGALFTRSSRSLFSADTGVGKSMFGLGYSFAMALGRDFLHWKAHRKARVLYVDAEMPFDLLKFRLRLASKEWFNIAPVELRDNMRILTRERYPDMPPIDTEEGQQWMLDYIDKHGPFDFATFDNLQSMMQGIQKEEESWLSIKDFTWEITHMQMGQLWMHHTGHDASRSYGTKSREWQMDTAMIAEDTSNGGPFVAFDMKFTKARVSGPDNFSDFSPVNITMKNGVWSSSGVKLSELESTILQILQQAHPRSLTKGELREKWLSTGVRTSSKNNSNYKKFDRAVDKLVMLKKALENRDIFTALDKWT